MIRLSLDLAWLYVQVVAETIWRDRRFRFLVWVLAIEMAIWREMTGLLSLDDVINDIVIGIIVSLPFLW